ncbi:hypothetical protein KEM54_005042 [Ascosphaera aggregata]|nr:hypothetical protein KEM54_005042 [Ascosphaera aggregata]
MVILLAGKNNWIGYLTGTSHERLNWLHRWFARTLWLTVTIHMCFWFRSWGRYHFIVAQLKKNSYARTGFASWLVLTFMLLASSKPIRVYGYEIFLPLHLCTWGGFIAAVYQHSPDEVKAWVWVPIGLFCFDRVSRMTMMVIANTRLLRLTGQNNVESSFWANNATFTPLYGNVTKISITNPSFKWRAGNHVLLGCHTLAPFQSHPFSIASIPADKRLDFFIQARKGATKRFFDYASKQGCLMGETGRSPSTSSKLVTIEGPYGTIRDLRQFDSVVLIAGGIGATYTVPLMRDIVYGWETACSQPRSGDYPVSHWKSRTNTRSIRFIWVIKSRFQITWFEEQLRKALRDIEECRAQRPAAEINLEINIYLTCNNSLVTATESQADTSSEAGDKYVSGVSALSDGTENKLKIEEARGHMAQTQPSATQPLPKEGESAPNSCGGGGCQCKHTVVDEDANEIRPCCCSGVPQSAVDEEVQKISVPLLTDGRLSALTASLNEDKEPPKYTQETYPRYSEMTAISNPLPQLRIFTGRPDSRSIMRASLERARGESGIVVCGPPGLVADVQCSMTALSDERAVHKGTGAQGIYFHSEGFWY